MKLERVSVVLILSIFAGCSKSKDQKSFDLILENTPNMKLIHMPNDAVTKMLAVKGIKIRNDGCPERFTRVPRGFYEPDGKTQPGCLPSFTNMSMPYEIDYIERGEKTPVPKEQIVH